VQNVKRQFQIRNCQLQWKLGLLLPNRSEKNKYVFITNKYQLHLASAMALLVTNVSSTHTTTHHPNISQFRTLIMPTSRTDTKCHKLATYVAHDVRMHCSVIYFSIRETKDHSGGKNCYQYTATAIAKSSIDNVYSYPTAHLLHRHVFTNLKTNGGRKHL
jgi:hypothetical protein